MTAMTEHTRDQELLYGRAEELAWCFKRIPELMDELCWADTGFDDHDADTQELYGDRLSAAVKSAIWELLNDAGYADSAAERHRVPGSADDLLEVITTARKAATRLDVERSEDTDIHEGSVHLADALLVDQHVTRAGELIGEIQTRFKEVNNIMRELVGDSGILCDWDTDADAPLLPKVFDSSPYGTALFHTVVDAWKHNVLGDLDDAIEKTYLDWRQVQEICRLAVKHERMLSAHCS